MQKQIVWPPPAREASPELGTGAVTACEGHGDAVL